MVRSKKHNGLVPEHHLRSPRSQQDAFDETSMVPVSDQQAPMWTSQHDRSKRDLIGKQLPIQKNVAQRERRAHFRSRATRCWLVHLQPHSQGCFSEYADPTLVHHDLVIH
jgi:hypothetical protein